MAESNIATEWEFPVSSNEDLYEPALCLLRIGLRQNGRHKTCSYCNTRVDVDDYLGMREFEIAIPYRVCLDCRLDCELMDKAILVPAREWI